MVDTPFLLEPFESAYLALERTGELRARVQAARQHLEECSACPRNCRSHRAAGETGFCRTGRYARLASAGPHFGEEDCLRGTRGSGTVFFALCNLHCVFCQNWDISQRAKGRQVTAEEIAEVMLALQDRSCHNINFVTPEHVVPQVIEAVGVAVPNGLRIPIVYNTSAYDSVVSLRLLDGIVDIYMPDFKFWRSETSERLSHAADYPQRARDALCEMQRQVGPLRFDRDGVARRGVLVRHLVMPGQLEESREIFHFLADQISRDTCVNIMAQYRPDNEVRGMHGNGFDDINRRPTAEEISAAYQAARDVGLWRFDKRL
jgi:putative pyruvate formate lyase activating enzyme